MNDSFSNFIVIILLGPPGSGKGTQAKLLSKRYQIPSISTGDLFREQMALETATGLKVKGFMQSGQLVPDSIVLEMLFNRVKRDDCCRGYILDGVPRTIAQAEKLKEYFENHSRVYVLSLDVPDEIIVNRASGRIVCLHCHAIYHQQFSPPKEEAICDKCGSRVVRRKDDEPEVVRNRLEVYHAQTQPLIDYYDHLKRLTHFDGTQAPEVIFQQIEKVLE